MSKFSAKELSPVKMTAKQELVLMKERINYLLSIAEVQRSINSFTLELLKDQAKVVNEGEKEGLRHVIKILEGLSLVDDNGHLYLCKFVPKPVDEVKDGVDTSGDESEVRGTVEEVQTS